MNGIPLFPVAASALAKEVDVLFLAAVGISIFFSVLISVVVVVMAIRYRRRSPDEVGKRETAPAWLEIVWSVIPLVIALGLFFWGARVFFTASRAPADAVEYWAVGKQWMWKFQAPDGRREINTLHVPVGRPIRITMTSEDVIHSLYFPAYRVKADVIPGRYSSIWFDPEKPGRYQIFCAEYCGTEHSRMIGELIVQPAHEYEAWLSGVTKLNGLPQSPVAAGEQLFTRLSCNTCHQVASASRGPALGGIFGRPVRMASGETVVVDAAYIRESILQPAARLVQGYQPIMPSYQGQVGEEEILSLIAYIKSNAGTAPATGATAQPSVPEVSR